MRIAVVPLLFGLAFGILIAVCVWLLVAENTGLRFYGTQLQRLDRIERLLQDQKTTTSTGCSKVAGPEDVGVLDIENM